MKNKTTILATLILSALQATTAQAKFSADGDLKDWIKAPVGASMDWESVLSPSIKVVHEDQTGDLETYLSPGFGGQAYDAEAMYTDQDDENYYLSIVTGLAPSTKEFPAGDISFSFGEESFKYGIVVKSDSENTKYKGGIGKQGDVFSVADWNYGLFDAYENQVTFGQGDPKNPTSIKAGQLIGNAEVSYKKAKFNGKDIKQLGQYEGDHYVIEAIIHKSLFHKYEIDSPLSIQWTMTCGNDTIRYEDVTIPNPPMNAPEPPVIALAGVALAFFVTKNTRNNRN